MTQTVSPSDSSDSPFHHGEQLMQERVGRRQELEQIGRQIIRPYMPDQHREFFTQLPFMVVGSVDDQGWPWASILPGKPGFVTSPTATTLSVAATPLPGDPLAGNLHSQAPLGLLGIEVGTRRRNRVNVHVTDTQDGVFQLAVDQSFGNCPQYIQRRSVDFIRDPQSPPESPRISSMTALDDAAVAMIDAADTFFVSSYVESRDRPEIEGVDVSHRGGRPGFVKVENNSLTIPDFPGNNSFNTLGNFLLNPKAGLVFLDFETGDILQLTGTVSLLWEDDSDIKSFTGAERGWRFTLQQAIRLHAALPFRSSLKDYSPNSLVTGNWEEAQAQIAAEANRNAWRPYKVSRIEDESAEIKSFYLEPDDGEPILSHEAGQYLTIRVSTGSDATAIRTYTVSSAPGQPHYRLSIKRESGGLVSGILHTRIKVGDVIDAQAPRGDFFLDTKEKRPAVLIAGGVGITPMISMAQHVARQGVLTRYTRSLTILHATHSTRQRAFTHAFRSLQHHSGDQIRYHTYVSYPESGEKSGIDFSDSGRISSDTLRQLLPLDDYDFYLCGPPSFMQSIYDALRQLGVRDVRILAEAFGPASLARLADDGSSVTTAAEEAEQAVIEFSTSGIEHNWHRADSTLLEVAESQGLSPAYGCRAGNCGSCATKMTSGSVVYRSNPTALCAKDEVLICCAVPADGTDTVRLQL